QIRAKFVETISGYEQYAMKWMGFVIVPFLIVVGIIEKKWILFFGAMFFQVMLYATNGYKIYPLALILTIVAFYGYGRAGFSLYTLGLFLIAMMGYGVYVGTGDLKILSVLINRLLILPAL